jgi:hypothetical protein
MTDWADLLWWHTWWSFDPNGSVHDLIWQHGFNLFEGCCWLVFAGLVARRYWRHRKSMRLELSYATAFVWFGISDFIQAYRLTSWLLVWKLINLIVLLVLRHRTIRNLYPGSKAF